MKKYMVFVLVTICSGALLLNGCGGAKTQTQNNPNMAALEGAPSWVTKDCRLHFAETPEANSIICGVGSVSGMSDRSLARQAAAGRGRTEIARFLQLRLQSMLKDYQKATNNPDGTLSTDTEIESVSKQITDITLSGTRVLETWISANGEFFSLVTLGVEDFSNAIASSGEIAPPVKTAVLEGAPKLFSELDAEGGYY